MAVCRSSAWAAKLAGATQAYWVYQHQVSKVAEAGEYLSQGALMVRGKKNFITVHSLQIGVGKALALSSFFTTLRKRGAAIGESRAARRTRVLTRSKRA